MRHRIRVNNRLVAIRGWHVSFAGRERHERTADLAAVAIQSARVTRPLHPMFDGGTMFPRRGEYLFVVEPEVSPRAAVGPTFVRGVVHVL